MRMKLIAVLLGALLIAPAGFAADHVVATSDMQARLLAAAKAREDNLLTLQRTLEAPKVAAVAAQMGVDMDQVRSAAVSLSDQELQDLAQRAAALDTDPVAGLTHDVETLLIIFLIVAIVILVLRAVD